MEEIIKEQKEEIDLERMEQVYNGFQELYLRVNGLCPTLEEREANFEDYVSGSSYSPGVIEAYDTLYPIMMEMFEAAHSSLDKFKEMCDKEHGLFFMEEKLKGYKSRVNKFEASDMTLTKQDYLLEKYGFKEPGQKRYEEYVIWDKLSDLFKNLNNRYQAATPDEATWDSEYSKKFYDKVAESAHKIREIADMWKHEDAKTEDLWKRTTWTFEKAIRNNVINDKCSLEDFIKDLREYEQIISDFEKEFGIENKDEQIYVLGLNKGEEENKNLIKRILDKVKGLVKDNGVDH